jgi:hypothetical protein
MSKQVFKNNKFGIAMRALLITMILSLIFSSVTFAAGGGRYKGTDAWSFGVHGDTQWTLSSSTNTQHTNKAYVNGELISLFNQQFIDAGVKFVIQVGDLSDRSGDAAMAERALRAQSLYNAGIGFYPLRGNHETYGSLYAYDNSKTLNIPAFRSNFPQTQGLSNTFDETNFSIPGNEYLKGLSYSFDYGDSARFVIVDVEQTHYVTKVAPVNPQSCVDAITPGTPEGITPYCGQGYFYFLNSWYQGYDSGLVVYQATHDIINGITVIYDDYANPVVVDGSTIQNITIHTGDWFYIDADSGKPSTDWKTWNEANPLQTYNGAAFDIIAPVATAGNRLTSSTSAANTEFWPGSQQEWISNRLDKNTRGTEHAFVFSHRPLLGGDHVDGFFGANPTVTPDDQNAFYASMEDNDVKYMISGHDHLYNRALLESPNGASEVEQLISIGASSKFYGPGELDNFFGAKNRETQISQEINTVGYYIYTVDGPRVTVDYYSSTTGDIQGDYCYPHGIQGDDNPYRGCANKPGTTKTVDGVVYQTGPLVPGTYKVTAEDFNFAKKETWGYSQNGQQFVIEQGAAYNIVKDSFENTNAKIIGGKNNSKTTDLTPETPRALFKTVNTGWVKQPNYIVPPVVKCIKDLITYLKVVTANSKNPIQSDIMSLWGMGEKGIEQTDTYVLSISYDNISMYLSSDNLKRIKDGKVGIATYVDGLWVNAVDQNFGGTKKFVLGKYNSKYGLGTYGIDLTTNTAWAVINYNADFAVTTK